MYLSEREPMAVGSSNRIVIELPNGLKTKLYAALRSKGMTLREWFVKSANKEIAGGKYVGARSTSAAAKSRR